ncbi:mucin-5AC-like isoform X3 [Oncorhynchus mykiss]|uniref:mucin-5AC-like isoform X3 n=1 Tax=Oncorhynchus mykiss TaxID=8022 RepID=UPI00187883F2|nr:mucin-5AC-like isoform X3 [Oncorhynchus mykiss]
MQRLQQQLEASEKRSTATSTPNSIPGTKAPSKANTPSQSPPKQSSSKPVRPTQKTKQRESPRLPQTEETAPSYRSPPTSPLSSTTLTCSKRKGQRTAHQVQPSTTAAATDTRGPLVEIKTHSSFQPIASSSRTNSTVTTRVLHGDGS